MLLSEEVNDLFNNQLKEWELAGVNYNQLDKVKTRKLVLGSCEIQIQFNPERMRSSSAKVDTKSIEARPCFLCSKNRPVEQRGIAFAKDLSLLVNPFPIFSRHLTIPSEIHTDQRILKNFEGMLTLAEAIPGFLVFYNGPQCGASAPDHFHLQAGNRGFLPIEADFAGRKFSKLLSDKSGVEIWLWSGYHRGIVSLKGSDIKKMSGVFEMIYSKLSDLQSDKPEPMLNILSYYEDGSWIIHIIPRKLHRPVQFFKEGAEKILLSPASVDLGGVLITPREEDFNKISITDIKDIFCQVCYSENEIMDFFNDI